MNYVKSLGITFIGIIILSFLATILYYFNIISTNFLQIINIIIPIIFILIGTIYLGKMTPKNGWLNGIIFGVIFVLIINIFNLAFFNEPYKMTNLLYYLIIIITSVLGSMLGINMKKEK